MDRSIDGVGIDKQGLLEPYNIILLCSVLIDCVFVSVFPVSSFNGNFSQTHDGQTASSSYQDRRGSSCTSAIRRFVDCKSATVSYYVYSYWYRYKVLYVPMYELERASASFSTGNASDLVFRPSVHRYDRGVT